MAVTPKIVFDYNKTRVSGNNKLLCHAPFQSINFSQNGNATVCCYNKTYVLGSYPDSNLRKIWFGSIAQALRKEMIKNPLPRGCENCYLQLESGNFAAVHAKHYDFHSDHWAKHFVKKLKTYIKQSDFVAYPRVLEFELSNTCNLECVMCDGYFSSSIRKNREQKPPLKMIFDENFIIQLDEFIPHLTDAKFLGGEPFLIPIYLKIWNRIIQMNPTCKVHITTNATIISDEIWRVLHKLNAVIIISIDSLNELKYNEIRKGANFQDVMRNIEKLHGYTKSIGSDISFSVCPMSTNWQDMPEIIQYGIDHHIYIYFNTVFNPSRLSLKNISKEEALKIINQYNAVKYRGSGHFINHNLNQIQGLTNMIKFWHQIE